MNDPRLPSSSSSTQSRSTRTIAQSIDAFAVYEEAVQTPLIEANNLSSLYYNAQDIGSTRPYAKLLREDFSSTAAVATTWLTLGADHRSQAVDIDLEALKIARRRLLRGGELRHPLGEKWTAQLLQHSDFTDQGQGARWIDDDLDEAKVDASYQKASTWSEGAASDRFERKFQAKQAKLRAKQKQDKNRESFKTRGSNGHNDGTAAINGLCLNDHTSRDEHHNYNGAEQLQIEEEDIPHLTLLHSSVLSSPIIPPPHPHGRRHSNLERPDIVASLNYALSYFHKRSDLIDYLTSVRNSLRKGTGVLISDQFAGPMGEAAKEGYGQGRELSAEEEEKEQDELWNRFASEEGDKGFLRSGESLDRLPSKLVASIPGVQLWRPDDDGDVEHEQVHSQDGASASQWPRGRLSLVRKGEVPHRTAQGEETVVEFEYWREDTPVDIKTNRFRMSLSFRFPADGSWVRDYFSYDFRFWTLAEVLEALEEVGFTQVRTEVLDRGALEELEKREAQAQAESRLEKKKRRNGVDDESEGWSTSENGGIEIEEKEEEEENTLALLVQTEREESRPAVTYKLLEQGDKVFARRSFGTYIVAKAPP